MTKFLEKIILKTENESVYIGFFISYFVMFDIVKIKSILTKKSCSWTFL
jgi:hypothetical protein